MPDLPRRLWRVEWRQGYGWPDVTRHENTARNFTTPLNAARQVANILAWPSHHELIGVFVSDPIGWSDFPLDQLPPVDAPQAGVVDC